MDIFSTSYDILVVALILMGLILAVIPVGKDIKALKSYRISVKVMAFSYVLLGCYCIYKVRYPLQMLSLPFLIAECTQVILLGIAHISLVNLNKTTNRFVLFSICPPLACMAIYFVIRAFCAHVAIDSCSTLHENIANPEVLARILWLGVYVAQTVFYAIVFFMNEADYRASLRNFLSETPGFRYNYARYSFFIALTIASVSVLICFSTDKTLSAVLNILMLILYAVMCLFYVQYPSLYFRVAGIFNELGESKQDESKDLMDWPALKSRIIEEKLYTIEGITVEQLALRLGVSKNLLSLSVNSKEGVNFSNFIGKLRIEEAQRLMREDMNRSIAEIAYEGGILRAKQLRPPVQGSDRIHSKRVQENRYLTFLTPTVYQPLISSFRISFTKAFLFITELIDIPTFSAMSELLIPFSKLSSKTSL